MESKKCDWKAVAKETFILTAAVAVIAAGVYFFPVSYTHLENKAYL